jgi:hypothetical protein
MRKASEATSKKEDKNFYIINEQNTEKMGKTLLPIHINRQPMILFESGSAIHDIIEMEFRKLGIRYRTVMTLRSTQSMIKMVEKNMKIVHVNEVTWVWNWDGTGTHGRPDRW